VGRGLAVGDFNRDGAPDILMTTNQGPAYLYRNVVTGGNRSVRFHLRGTKSNRDGIGAIVRLTTSEGTQSRMVHTGSSYLSQSEMALTFGIGRQDRASRVAIEWPSGAVQEFKDVRPGGYRCTEGAGLVAIGGY